MKQKTSKFPVVLRSKEQLRSEHHPALLGVHRKVQSPAELVWIKEGIKFCYPTQS